MCKKICIYVLICISVLACNNGVAQKQAKVITPNEMQKIIASEDVIVIDVRTPEEFSSGHLKNAVNIDFMSPTFKQEISRLEKDKPVLIYCRSGNRSGRSIEDFITAGFDRIFDLKGGILAWQSDGLPVVNN